VRYRAPHYVSDWTDAFKDTYSFSKTVNATAWLYFSTLAPALALGVVLREETNGAIGPTEVLLAEGVGNMAFSLIAGSPLLVLRVTGTAVAWVKILATWFGRGGMFEGRGLPRVPRRCRRVVRGVRGSHGVRRRRGAREARG
jgi:hypothetical protein